MKQQAVVSEEELQERDNKKKGESETKVVSIQLREYLEHSGSLTGRKYSIHSIDLLSFFVENCNNLSSLLILYYWTGKSFDQRGMVLPFQPLSMSFSNISYYVDVPLVCKLLHLFIYNNEASTINTS